jgi:hypothetical protein
MHIQRALQTLNKVIISNPDASYYRSLMIEVFLGQKTKPRNQDYLSISDGAPESGGGGASLITGEAPEAASDDDDGGDDAEDPDPRSPKYHRQLSTHPPAQHIAGASIKPKQAISYPALEQVTRPAITTREAAHYMNRAEQTLRIWACKENGAIRPIRINGRLAWPTAEIKRVLGVA